MVIFHRSRYVIKTQLFALSLTTPKMAFVFSSGLSQPEKTIFFRDSLILIHELKVGIFGHFSQVAICKKHNFSHFD